MRHDAVPALLLAMLWLLTHVGLSRYLVLALPHGLRSELTLSAYLWLVQVLTTGIGFALVFVASRRNPRLWWILLPFEAVPRRKGESSSGEPLSRPPALGQSLLLAAGLAPAVYVVAHGTGMALAYRVLLSELAARGVQGVQNQAGELGRAALTNSLWVVGPFLVLVAPLAEELLFRGACFGAFQSLSSVSPLLPRARAASSMDGEARGGSQNGPPSGPLSIPGLARSRGGQLCPRIPSLLAWLLTSALFGWMHADLSGGMGIMRTTSACVLGLACGCMRWKAKSVLPCVILHAVFNLVSLATLRGWLVFAAWPTKYALPTLLLVVAPITALVALTISKLVWPRR